MFAGQVALMLTRTARFHADRQTPHPYKSQVFVKKATHFATNSRILPFQRFFINKSMHLHSGT